MGIITIVFVIYIAILVFKAIASVVKAIFNIK
jgi:hypothetical protein